MAEPSKLRYLCSMDSTVPEPSRSATDLLQRFRDLYDHLGPDHLQGLDGVYSKHARFSDPFHDIEGLPALEAYFRELYRNVETCRFEWGPWAASPTGQSAFQEWTLVLRHRTFRPGETLRLPGCTRLTLSDGLVIDHRDHFDSSAMIYQRIPVLGWVIGKIRNRMGST